ncbi:ArsR/SmtB family transcription factor [Streptomyces laurentii]|uniref:ArsR/SmtB family transcription factor n=1 Tax=Streptomyces laurentii TaxID=39478 RepID=UPI003679C017
MLTADYPVERDLHLQGRGLLPVPYYPVDRTRAPDASLPSLPRLLGSTRAALLHEAASLACATTSELADATGVSLPSVSRQLAVLRESGLVTSRRDGKRVIHATTPLGCRLLGRP